jgi:hypothetical protein
MIPPAAARFVPASLAAAVAGWTAWKVPFYPSGWPIALALLAGAAAAVRPRLGLAFALAVPVLPLGNFALAAALLYVAIVAALFVLSWREPTTGAFAALGPILAPVAALGALPLLALAVRSPVRRAVHVATAVALAALVAGIRHVALPFDGAPAPHGLGLAESTSVTATASVLWHAFLVHPALPVEAAVLGVAAALLPIARERGLWHLAGLGAALLAASLLPVPGVAAIPLVVSIWGTVAVAAWSAEPR